VAGGIRERCHGGPSRTVARRQRWSAAHGGPPPTVARHERRRRTRLQGRRPRPGRAPAELGPAHMVEVPRSGPSSPVLRTILARGAGVLTAFRGIFPTDDPPAGPGAARRPVFSALARRFGPSMSRSPLPAATREPPRVATRILKRRQGRRVLHESRKPALRRGCQCVFLVAVQAPHATRWLR